MRVLFFGALVAFNVSAQTRAATNEITGFFYSNAPILKGLAAYRSQASARAVWPDAEAPAEPKPEKKAVSTWKAVGLSVLLPGSGHLYLGSKNRAQVFFGIETAGWGSFAGFLWFSSQREKDYQNYAVNHAGADRQGKNEQFWRSLTFYENRDDYNKLGPLTNSTNPFYPENVSYNWQWDSAESQKKYRLLRNSSKTAHRRAMFTLALLGVERLVAAADSYRLAKKINARAKGDKLEVYFEPAAAGGRLILSRRF